jgi:hypothetical protein
VGRGFDVDDHIVCVEFVEQPPTLRRGAAKPGETRRPHVGGAFERHGLHREIYLSEVNETDPAKMRTILRQPIRIEHDRA